MSNITNYDIILLSPEASVPSRGNIDCFIKFPINFYHPLRGFLKCFIHKAVGHLFIVCISHGASDSCESVGVAAKGDGFLDAVHIVNRIQEADYGGTHSPGTGGVESERWLYLFV